MRRHRAARRLARAARFGRTRAQGDLDCDRRRACRGGGPGARQGRPAARRDRQRGRPARDRRGRSGSGGDDPARGGGSFQVAWPPQQRPIAGESMSDETVKYLLPESEIPTHWINLLPDLPGDPLPPLHPGTLQPAGPDDLTPIFPMSLILQEVSSEPQVEIPDAVREAYKLWRPTPLVRARRWERELDTPAHI